MKKYEILFIIDKDVADDKREEAIEKVVSYITDNNGEIIDLDKWGMKKYAYTINFKNEGYYVLIKFVLDPSLLLELKRRMGLNEAYVREMITTVIENKKTLAPKKARAPRRNDAMDNAYAPASVDVVENVESTVEVVAEAPATQVEETVVLEAVAENTEA